jgi:hypothetical protein
MFIVISRMIIMLCCMIIMLCGIIIPGVGLFILNFFFKGYKLLVLLKDPSVEALAAFS